MLASSAAQIAASSCLSKVSKTLRISASRCSRSLALMASSRLKGIRHVEWVSPQKQDILSREDVAR